MHIRCLDMEASHELPASDLENTEKICLPSLRRLCILQNSELKQTRTPQPKRFMVPMLVRMHATALHELASRCIRKLSVERDCAESQSQQYRWLALTPNLLRLVLRTQPRSWPTAKFTDNVWMHCWRVGLLSCTRLVFALRPDPP